MKRSLFCILLMLAGSLMAAQPTPLQRMSSGLGRKHVLVEADYLPDKHANAAELTERSGDESSQETEDLGLSTPSSAQATSPSSIGSPQAAVARESSQAGMSPEALRVLEMPKNEVGLGHDPSVAVSLHYIVAIEAHSLVLYDKKTGKRLPQTTGIPTAMTSDGLFRPFTAKTFDGTYDKASGKLIGTPNPTNLNNFAELPSGFCDLTDRSKQSACATEVFDLRVIYDSQRGRFIFAGTSRRGRPKGNPDFLVNVGGKQVTLLREMTLIAVSRDEDPRNGFHEYLYTEGGDWPRIAVNERVVTVTTWDGKTVLQFPADDLAKGARNPKMVRWNMFEKNWPFRGYVFTVAEREPWSGYTWLIRSQSNEQFVTLFAIQGIGGRVTEVRIPIRDAGTHPLTSMHDWWTDPVMRSGKLYLASTDSMSPRMVVRNGIDVATHRPPVFSCLFYDEQWISQLLSPDPAKRTAGAQERTAGPCHVRLLGFSLDIRPNGIRGVNHLDMNIGEAASDDPPGAVMSYILPAIDVTRRGAVVMVYIRTQHNRLPDRSREISPEVRYSVYYPGEKAIRHSRLLHRGSGVDPHPNPNEKPALRAGNYFGLDLAQVAVDEEDVAWMAHGYSIGPAQFQEVIGAVRP